MIHLKWNSNCKSGALFTAPFRNGEFRIFLSSRGGYAPMYCAGGIYEWFKVYYGDIDAAKRHCADYAASLPYVRMTDQELLNMVGTSNTMNDPYAHEMYIRFKEMTSGTR